MFRRAFLRAVAALTATPAVAFASPRPKFGRTTPATKPHRGPATPVVVQPCEVCDACGEEATHWSRECHEVAPVNGYRQVVVDRRFSWCPVHRKRNVTRYLDGYDCRTPAHPIRWRRA